MGVEKAEDVKDTAMKLGEIYTQSPTDYFYIKGWIHCLLEQETTMKKQKPKKPPDHRTA